MNPAPRKSIFPARPKSAFDFPALKQLHRAVIALLKMRIVDGKVHVTDGGILIEPPSPAIPLHPFQVFNPGAGSNTYRIRGGMVAVREYYPADTTPRYLDVRAAQKLLFIEDTDQVYDTSDRDGIADNDFTVAFADGNTACLVYLIITQTLDDPGVIDIVLDQEYSASFAAPGFQSPHFGFESIKGIIDASGAIGSDIAIAKEVINLPLAIILSDGRIIQLARGHVTDIFASRPAQLADKIIAAPGYNLGRIYYPGDIILSAGGFYIHTGNLAMIGKSPFPLGTSNWEKIV